VAAGTEDFVQTGSFGRIGKIEKKKKKPNFEGVTCLLHAGAKGDVGGKVKMAGK